MKLLDRPKTSLKPFDGILVKLGTLLPIHILAGLDATIVCAGLICALNRFHKPRPDRNRLLIFNSFHIPSVGKVPKKINLITRAEEYRRKRSSKMKYLVSLIIALAPLAPAFGDNTMLKLYNKDYEDMIWQDRTGQHKVEIQTDDNQSQQCSIRYKLGTGMQVGQYVPYLDCR